MDNYFWYVLLGLSIIFLLVIICANLWMSVLDLKRLLKEKDESIIYRENVIKAVVERYKRSKKELEEIVEENPILEEEVDNWVGIIEMILFQRRL